MHAAKLRLLAMLFASTMVSPVVADIVIDASAGSGPLENVQSFSPGGNTSMSQTAEAGNTGFNVTLMSDINITNQGANTIEPISNDPPLFLDTMMWFPENFDGFGEFSVNVVYAEFNDPGNDINVTVDYLDSMGAPQSTGIIPIDNSATQRLFVNATMGEVITKITVDSIGTTLISGYQQTRVSIATVPEPSSLACCGVALCVGLVGVWRRKLAARS